jgi:hypothetical protein
VPVAALSLSPKARARDEPRPGGRAYQCGSRHAVVSRATQHSMSIDAMGEQTRESRDLDLVDAQPAGSGTVSIWAPLGYDANSV